MNTRPRRWHDGYENNLATRKQSLVLPPMVRNSVDPAQPTGVSVAGVVVSVAGVVESVAGGVVSDGGGVVSDGGGVVSDGGGVVSDGGGVVSDGGGVVSDGGGVVSDGGGGVSDGGGVVSDGGGVVSDGGGVVSDGGVVSVGAVPVDGVVSGVVEEETGTGAAPTFRGTTKAWGAAPPGRDSPGVFVPAVVT